MGFFDQSGKNFASGQNKVGVSLSARRLRAQIKTIEAEIGRMYTAIGMKCYKAHTEGAQPEGLDIFYANIASLSANIAEINAEIDRLNNVVRCKACNAAVSCGVRFCPNCGTRMAAPSEESAAAENDAAITVESTETENA